MKNRRSKPTAPKRRQTPKVARRRGPAAAGGETEVARLKRERDEAHEQQEATAEVLRVIRSSPSDVQPVFDMIAESAQRLCEAQYCFVYRFDGHLLHFVAHSGLTPDVLEMNQRAYPAPPGRKSAAARAVLERKVVQIPDVRADPEFALGPMASVGGFGSVVGVPILRDGAPVGSIAVTRVQSGLLPERQIELLKTFADQAVIAIDNARLFDAVQGRTAELSESLERQTATSEVLRVISSSPGELQPVFDAILENATRICGAKFGNLLRFENGAFRRVALYGAGPAWAEDNARDPTFVPTPVNPIGRLMRSKEAVHVPDMRAERGYIDRDPVLVALVESAGARTSIAVPMLKDNELVGAIAIYRKEVLPFTDKQVELLSNFAAQAVIAIENTRLLSELRESLDRQTATSEVLKVIASSTGELQPVFGAMLANAARLCEARYGALWLCQGSGWRAAAMHGDLPPAYIDLWRSGPWFNPGPNAPMPRVAAARRPIHIPDMREDISYLEGGALPVSAVEVAGVRTLLCVPMTRENEIIGVITIYRTEVKPFTEKQIELVANFAAQGVIAIENTRLLNELRKRTDDLSDALEQQTATSEVLKVISSSTGELQPVFETLLENATRLCGAKFGNLYLCEGDALRTTAMHNVPPAFAEMRMREPLVRPEPGSLLRAMVDTRKTIQIADATKEQAYIDGQSRFVTAVELGGFRSMIVVPMLKDDDLIGAIVIYRKETGNFADKQIELVQNFAAQAVIAIENTRLLNELRQRTDDLAESLEQQTATSEVLSVISSSTGELEPVFRAVLENAVQICNAKFGNLFLGDAKGLRIGATFGAPQAYVDFLNKEGMFVPNPKVGVGQMVNTKARYQVTDLRATPTHGDGLREATINLAGARTLIGVPLLKEDQVVGAIIIYRQEVRPFSEKQIELLTNFAAQAVIAIENTRLLNELRESLQQQTATGEILASISGSLTDTKPVFDAIVRNLLRLFGTRFAVVQLLQDGVIHMPAADGEPGFEKLIGYYPRPLDDSTVGGVTMLAKKTVYFSSVIGNPEAPVATQKFAQEFGFNSAIFAPMMRGDTVIGAIGVAHNEPRTFHDKKIALIRAFADQAVIAIENVRLFDDVQKRTHELTESLEQQTATSEVLKVISSSQGELEPVFQSMLENATRLCEASYGNLLLWEGDAWRMAAVCGDLPAQALEQWRPGNVFRPGPEVPFARSGKTRKVVQVADLREDAAYRSGDPLPVWAADVIGARTLVAIPMLKEDELVGAIVIYRRVVQPFTEKQIELVSNFAAQAVIAIENARLLNELRESLEQQTATSEVLKVISSSPGELKPVFESMLENATRICGANFGNLLLVEGDAFRMVALHGAPEAFAEERRREPVIRPWPGSDLDQLRTTKKFIHTADIVSDGNAATTAIVKLAGARTFLNVPMVKDNELVGVIGIYRQVVHPFSEKQIELVSNFAAQAVIAIENTRLLSELRQSLAQQTATADVLKVISRSTFDLKTVLDTLLKSAAQLCEADQGTITQRKGETFYRSVSYGFPPAFAEYVKDRPVEPGRETGTGRALLEGRVIHIPDVQADPDYTWKDAQRLGGFRTMLGVPMLREGVPVGVLTLTRTEVRPFTDKQIELVSTFADQAAIAIENVRLFESVEARTRELGKSLEELRTAQDRLIQTEKLASLGQLTAGIAHEIKNPLNFVNNFSSISVELIDELREALNAANLNDKLRAQVAEVADMLQSNLVKVVQHGKRADSIVKNMLLHSRQGSGEHRPIDINAVVEESLNLAYHGARAEKQGFNITLVRSFDPAAGEVDLFPQEITRVLLNLISNGFYAATKRKAETNGGYEPTLAAATKNLGDSVEIRIRDNGTGIPPEVKEKMFNPFFTTKPAGEGTGLGLSLSYDIIVKQHAGSIEVNTQPGEFTEFRIVLPRGAATIAKSGDHA